MNKTRAWAFALTVAVLVGGCGSQEVTEQVTPTEEGFQKGQELQGLMNQQIQRQQAQFPGAAGNGAATSSPPQ